MCITYNMKEEKEELLWCDKPIMLVGILFR